VNEGFKNCLPLTRAFSAGKIFRCLIFGNLSPIRVR
jgi:hypothetical protein